MAKRKSASYMTPGEQIAGTVFFVIYLVVLPFATAPLFRLAERLLDANISPSLQNAIYYYDQQRYSGGVMDLGGDSGVIQVGVVVHQHPGQPVD